MISSFQALRQARAPTRTRDRRIAFIVAKNVPQDSAAVALGIFTCGVVPGGGISNMFCFLLDGDVSLSVTMTTISGIAALGMTPLWIFTLGSTFKDDQVALEIPYLKIMETLALLILPIFVGIFIQLKFPKLEKIISKILKPVILVVVAGTISLGIYTNFYVFQMLRPMVILAGCLLPYCGYLVGALTALVTCQTWTHVKTIAIETGIQNTAIAFMMLFLSLPPPDNQLAAVAPAASAIMTPQPLFITVVIYLIYKRWLRKKEDTSEDETEAAADGLMSSEKGGVRQDSNEKWFTFLTDGNGKSALIVVWEKLTGIKTPDPAAEMLNKEIIIPSPSSTADEKEGLWSASAWEANASATKKASDIL
ncbi:Ileal sodium/bile acid cotransporter [Plakobranchus ocellatus]|uniref:Ileal sodium/bile acid cotransporter n=1 Tax=Plakobranchus ocellatus TaxID=259542 RepID=A0AAV4BY72_9GAST|nr:Ileal sodium/bile acid cotransporter [Plakobranchus ocellatus]